MKRKRKDFEAKEEGEKQYLGFVNFFFKKKKEEKRKKQRTREKHRRALLHNDTE